MIFPCGQWLGDAEVPEAGGGVGEGGGGGRAGARADGGGAPLQPSDRVFQAERNLFPCLEPEKRDSIALLERPLTVESSAVVLPDPRKVKQGMRAVNRRGFGYGGEDAYFQTSSACGTLWAAGVADGVYAWREAGIDAGLLSQHMVLSAKDSVESGWGDALEMMERAERRAQVQGIQGSTTFCLLLVNLLEGRVHSATLGDSGFLVVSNPWGREKGAGEVKFRTAQQEHSFGCPFQLGHHEGASRPEDAMLSSVLVQRGDVVVVGSDGLFDNVTDCGVAETVRGIASKSPGAPRPGAAQARSMAQELSRRAFEASVDRNYVTPYSRDATEYFDMVYSGGKKDDITVVVAVMQ